MTLQIDFEKILSSCKDDTLAYKDAKKQFQKLESYSRRELNIKPIDLPILLDTHRQLRSIRNKKASYLEQVLLHNFIKECPTLLKWQEEEEVDLENETLEEVKKRITLKAAYAQDDTVSKYLHASAQLLQFAIDIVNSPKNKSARYRKRVEKALQLIYNLSERYFIPEVKALLYQKAENEQDQIQFWSLSALEAYYEYIWSEKLTEAEIQKLNDIINTTEDRSIVVSCCSIMVDKGVMDDMDATITVDDWKDRVDY